MTYKPKILAFAGSLRQGSFNKKLVKIAAQAAKEAGVDLTYIDLLDYPLPIYNGDIEENEGLPGNALELKALMVNNDGFIIASPEYNSSISGVLKNTIDWVSRKATKDEANLSCFVDKVALIMSASPGNLGGLRGLVHLRSILSNINTIVMPGQKCISLAADAFDDEGHLKDPKQHKEVIDLTSKFIELTRKIKSAQEVEDNAVSSAL